MADEKQHPFQNFDRSKLVITPRSGGQPAQDTPGTEVAELDPDPIEDVNEPATTQAQTTTTTIDDDKDLETDPEKVVTDEPAATVTDQPTDQPTGEYTQEDFDADFATRLQETSGGRITSQDQITAILSENDSLREQLKNKEPEFPSERAKKVYDFAVKNDGNELAAAGQYLRVQGLDLAKLSPKDKQFELFALNNPEMTRESAKEVFEAMYSKEFADVDTDVVAKYQHDKRTSEAEKKILALQQEYSKAPERTASGPAQPSPEEIQRITTEIDRSLSDFGGLVMQFGDNPEDQVNVPLSGEDASAFREALIDPNKFLERIMDSSVIDGKFSNEAYRDNMFRLWNFDRIVTEARTNGFTTGQIKIVKDNKNTVVPKGQSGTAAPLKKTLQQTMKEAVQASNNR